MSQGVTKERQSADPDKKKVEPGRFLQKTLIPKNTISMIQIVLAYLSRTADTKNLQVLVQTSFLKMLFLENGKGRFLSILDRNIFFNE